MKVYIRTNDGITIPKTLKNTTFDELAEQMSECKIMYFEDLIIPTENIYCIYRSECEDKENECCEDNFDQHQILKDAIIKSIENTLRKLKEEK